VEKAESPLRSGATENVLFTEGWVPTKHLSDLNLGLRKAVGDAYHVEVLEDEGEGHHAAVAADGGDADGTAVEDEEEEDFASLTPVLLDNPDYIRVHEELVDLVSKPAYNEIDPSVFMFLSFPLMFGMMVGDIGYGIAFMLTGWMLLRMESPRGFMGKHWKGIGIFVDGTRTRMIKMIMFSGFITAIWGFLYGEMFGFELYGPHGVLTHKSLYIVPLDLWLPISRVEEANFMLVLCIYIGALHLLIGLTLGFVNEARNHGGAHAFFAKGSWILIVIGGFIFFYIFLTGDGLDFGDTMTSGSLLVFILGIVFLLIGEGMHGVLELPSILSNILSYTRLFAIGLSSLGIALAFNSIVALLWSGGVGGMIGGAIIFFLGHTVNLFLALLAPSLHALRLHYVEWMTKFFTGGGVEYRPLGRTRIYTEV
jgi:V/A-type H+-transporting ATPase subunit I